MVGAIYDSLRKLRLREVKREYVTRQVCRKRPSGRREFSAHKSSISLHKNLEMAELGRQEHWQPGGGQGGNRICTQNEEKF